MDSDLQAALTSFRESLDAQDDAIDALNKKVKTDRLLIGAVGVGTGISMFMLFQTMKALRNTMETVQAIGGAVQQLAQPPMHMRQPQPPPPAQDPASAPAESPASETPEWAKHAMQNDDMPAGEMDETLGFSDEDS